MRVLVIGGTKFLGYHLVHHLIELGVKVVLFNRGITPDNFADKVERIVGDRNNHKNFYETFHKQRFDVVVDLIGYDPEDIEVAIKTFKNYIGQYIFISTGQVYLVTKNKHQPANEEDYYQNIIDCPPGEEAAYLYGVRKRACEDLLVEAFNSQHFPSTRFRCPIIHGPHDYTLRLYSYLIRLQDEHPLIISEGGDSIIRHIYVKDVANTIASIFQIDQTKGKVYNLASEEVLLLSELVELMAKILMKRQTVYHIPANFIERNGISLEISPFSGKWVSYLDSTLAKEEIDFTPTAIKEWLGETVNWFINDYNGDFPENYRFREKEIALAKWWKQERLNK